MAELIDFQASFPLPTMMADLDRARHMAPGDRRRN
jgi:hypothetical protein